MVSNLGHPLLRSSLQTDAEQLTKEGMMSYGQVYQYRKSTWTSRLGDREGVSEGMTETWKKLNACITWYRMVILTIKTYLLLERRFYDYRFWTIKSATFNHWQSYKICSRNLSLIQLAIYVFLLLIDLKRTVVRVPHFSADDLAHLGSLRFVIPSSQPCRCLSRQYE